MTPDAPEFVTKTLSPLSPLPVHPPEPSNIPVLRNQIDPILNMTSTFDAAPAVQGSADATHDPNSHADTPSADSSFSDAYKEADGMEGKKDDTANQGTVVSDDYAMTFDSDGEAHSDSQDVSQANIEQESTSVQANTLPSHVSHDPFVANLIRVVQDTIIPDAESSPIQPTTNANPSEISPEQTQSESASQQPHTYEDIASGGIDIQQLLDNITANAEKNEAASALSPPSSATATSFPKTSGLPTHSSLPPRPQVPAKRFHDDIQKYHAGVPKPHTYRAPGMNMPLVASGAPGTSTDPRGGLPPPPTASFRSPQSAGSPISPGSYQKLGRLTTQDRDSNKPRAGDDADVRWGPEIQKKYDEFIVQERVYVTEGMWDRFPPNSRLFIGNLPSEKVTKRDVFHIFHKYGKLAQVAIKQAYGFVQFETADACFAALDHEQGAVIRDKKMHLEISKPQKNSRNAQASAAPSQRTRSPDRGSRQGQGRGNDRYDGRSGPTYRKDEYGRPLRDDYRPGRLARPASPPRDLREFYGREDYEYSRGGRDSYDGRAQRRSRSRSPFGQRDSGRYRERSPSPRTRQANEDANLQIPRRASYNVPDVQIILMSQLDHNFISWVEGELAGRGLKSEVMFLSPRLDLEAVIRRQVMEGVHAVSQLDIQAQNSSKIPLRVFDRQAGASNVRFNEYQDLEPKIAAELVLRTKQTQAPTPNYAQPPAPTYPQTPMPAYSQPPAPLYPPQLQPQYAPPPQYQPPPAAPAAPDLANLVGQLDNATLQKLLGSMNTPQAPQNAPAVSSNASIDLAGLLGGLQPQQPQQTYQPLQPASEVYAGYQNGAAAQQQAPQQSAQQVQNIMAQLAKFRQ